MHGLVHMSHIFPFYSINEIRATNHMSICRSSTRSTGAVGSAWWDRISGVSSLTLRGPSSTSQWRRSISSSSRGSCLKSRWPRKWRGDLRKRRKKKMFREQEHKERKMM
ncbi:hypothetical protein SAY87_018216 [Trapa incisa]|uniref:Uncharacterized protein n=1 Tax=Trapa incisa TaxID=236973 RepID=A0AAN7L520_9MYRT|nr:hypothetical protein SAY87_018216 [Trapa incisa]